MNNKLAFHVKKPWLGIGHFVITIVILGAITGFASDTSNEDEFTFYFNPPDHTSFVETLRDTKTITSQFSEPETQIMENKTKYVILKTDSGYSVTAEPLRPSKKVSQDMSGMLTDMLSNVVLTYDLDQQGSLLKVRGTDSASKR